MIYSFSGHRLHKLYSGKWSFTDRAIDFLNCFAVRTLQDLDITHKDYCIVGGAHGWDQSVAHACWVLGIPYTLVIPCADQDIKWPENIREDYQEQIRRAKEVITLYPKYNDRCMDERDRKMVDDSERLISLLNPALGGGTRSTVDYATRTRGADFTINVWGQWKKLKAAANFPLL